MSKSIAKNINHTLARYAESNGLVDSNGLPNVGRMMALNANDNLLSVVADRAIAKIEAGHDASARGLMIQINKRIKAALGASVADMQEDGEFQEAVALIRSKCVRLLNKSNIDWSARDWKESDQEIKARVYLMIERMAAAYLGTGEKV